MQAGFSSQVIEPFTYATSIETGDLEHFERELAIERATLPNDATLINPAPAMPIGADALVMQIQLRSGTCINFDQRHSAATHLAQATNKRGRIGALFDAPVRALVERTAGMANPTV